MKEINPIYGDRYNEYVKQLIKCQHQSDHEEADMIIAMFLDELGYNDIAHLYRACPKWFS